MRTPSFLTAADAVTTRPAGLWAINGDAVAEIERFDIGPAILLVPSEHVSLMTASLPVRGRRARAAALPFAIEDRIAAPLADVHVALGAEIAPETHLAAIAAHRSMRRWVDIADAAGLAHAALVPDVLALPIPAPGGWSVDLAGERALVRLEDETGFAIPARHLAAAWRAAGQPGIAVFGEPIAFAPIAAASELALAPLAERLARPAIDLRQGPYAGRARERSPLLKRIVTIAAIGMVAHGAIAAADTIALETLAGRRAAEVRSLIAQVAPTAVIGDDLASGAADILPENGAGPSSFLPLLSRVSVALKPLGATVTMRSLAFDAANNSMSIEIEAGDIATLQRVGAALSAARLSATAGAASQDQGKAVGAFLVRGAA